MKKHHVAWCVAAGIITLIVWAPGCENNSDVARSPAGHPDQFSLSPSGTTLGSNDTTVAFVAVGGDRPYAWRVADEALGTISNTTEGIATYTRAGTTEGINVVVCRDGHGWEARANVVQDNSITNAP